ncbi:6-phosphofructokinase [Agathobaculum sp. NSJ-28]|uniref:ATP-dependent 6-phosphofructokinase n=2 Tax=Agathobaculum TaxID=2048137 RepID=A0A923LVE2_9FIRM|nr:MULTISPECIES: ATP-dependent 6-phosphofructokinase [Butyricicoccaceae]MBS6883859.1 6-phosphofructokinase [Clostridiaceae bacterium]SCJ26825.1 6-phosphofructokinase [uncultured Butyricicoccus sp.]MBC5726071.1 6-phosphofructokinase [Agathobaculum faecis]MCU6789566.1 6-phosphofructokinase [Agathobaculum ammoniilyticum]WOC75564.1 ATP-dependent 6-phosphofructokinase [Intestinibacillus sp. NTUH-41-i26]
MRIGMLTSGGDCQGLNAALRGVAKTLYNEFGDKLTLYGIRDGYRGLIEGDYHEMKESDFSDILTVGGTILGTSRQPFKSMLKAEENEETKLEKMLKTIKEAKFDCLVILGGNGTHKTANLLSEHGVHVVTLPKTIDNDLWGTEMTFGFQSAVDIATTVIDSIHSTAFSHSRVFIVEVMGHKAGWLTLYAGIASGADVIIIPEIPYSAKAIAKAIQKREKSGKRFSILAVAEGAISQEEAKMSKKEFKAAREAMPYPSISYRIAEELKELTGQEIRVTIPGHYQRGGAPCPADRLLTSRLGVAAAQLIRDGKFGNMVAVQDDKIVPVPLSEVAGKLKTVPPDSDIVQAARDLGLSMGD